MRSGLMCSCRWRWPLLAAMAAFACRGEARQASSQEALAALVDSLRAPVERAAGLTFKSPPSSAMRSREQVSAYLVAKLDEELPPERMRGIETAYRMFGLLPDTLQLRALLLDLYTEQVAGYYDPDSAMLFGVEATDPGVYLAVGSVLLFATLLACWLPARRAGRIDPMVALRND